MAFIYRIINKVNGKSYVGKTELTVEKRFKQHIQDSKKDRCKSRPIYRAINKYGEACFEVELIEETNEPESREIFWIEFYNTYSSGYNATLGGDGKPYVDAQRILTLYEGGMNVKTIATETGYCVDTVSTYIKKVHNKIRVSKKPSCFRGVKCIEIDLKFESTRDAARFFIERLGLKQSSVGGYASHISQCCNGIRKSVFKLSFEYT